jgi:16S rRNA C967 or C1407 C5-methylase (RsmB/RsmF family)
MGAAEVGELGTEDNEEQADDGDCDGMDGGGEPPGATAAASCAAACSSHVLGAAAAAAPPPATPSTPSATRLDALADLQRRLLANGFRLLKPGGTLVYSTCSLALAQNEDVVAWLLAREPAAAIVPVDLAASIAALTAGQGGQAAAEEGDCRVARSIAARGSETAAPAAEPSGAAVDARRLFASLSLRHMHATATQPPCLPGGIPGTLRFHPLHSGTGGLFIARLTKKAG